MPANNRPIKRKTYDCTSEFESETKKLHLTDVCNVSTFTYSLIGDKESKHDDSTILGSLVDDGRQLKAPVPTKETYHENSVIPVPSNDQNALPSTVSSLPKVEKNIVSLYVS